LELQLQVVRKEAKAINAPRPAFAAALEAASNVGLVHLLVVVEQSRFPDFTGQPCVNATIAPTGRIATEHGPVCLVEFPPRRKTNAQ
jgi:hypothetical protein